jgi:C4-dicarboxylate-specific signal transduction histidine kinase
MSWTPLITIAFEGRTKASIHSGTGLPNKRRSLAMVYAMGRRDMAEKSQGLDYSSRTGVGEAASDHAREPGPASEDKYRKLIFFMPTPLWQVDSRAAGEAFKHLRAAGITDIAAYLDAHQEVVETACDTVLVTEVNREAVALFHGRSPADMIRPVRYLFAATPDMAKRVMVAHFEGRRSYMEEAKILTFDGKMRDVIFSVTYPTPPEQQETTFITITDITDRLLTEAQLRQLQADYAHAARISTLGEVATSIAHEVKQPLAAIVTNGETALHWLSREDLNVTKVRQLTSRIVESAYHAGDIIQRIRMMAIRGEPERVTLDMKSVTAEGLSFVRHDIESKKIALAIDIAQTLPKVIGDRIQLQQVIVNLLLNSIQAIDHAQSPERHIRIALHAEDGLLAFSIRDSGPGIAQHSLDHLFESFFTTKEGGMGIGLAICRSIVTAHGGNIAVSNDPAGGAHFRFTLPVAKNAADL